MLRRVLTALAVLLMLAPAACTQPVQAASRPSVVATSASRGGAERKPRFRKQPAQGNRSIVRLPIRQLGVVSALMRGCSSTGKRLLLRQNELATLTRKASERASDQSGEAVRAPREIVAQSPPESKRTKDAPAETTPAAQPKKATPLDAPKHVDNAVSSSPDSLAQAKAEREAALKREEDERIRLAEEHRKLDQYAQSAAQATTSGLTKAGGDAADKAQTAEQERLAQEAKEKTEAEATARKQAETEAQKQAEAQAQARKTAEAEELLRGEQEARSNAEAKERAKREVEARLKLEAEEHAKTEAQARLKLDADERAKREAEARAKKEADERGKRRLEQATAAAARSTQLGLSAAVEGVSNRLLATERRRLAREQQQKAKAEAEARRRKVAEATAPGSTDGAGATDKQPAAAAGLSAQSFGLKQAAKDGAESGAPEDGSKDSAKGGDNDKDADSVIPKKQADAANPSAVETSRANPGNRSRPQTKAEKESKGQGDEAGPDASAPSAAPEAAAPEPKDARPAEAKDSKPADSGLAFLREREPRGTPDLVSPPEEPGAAAGNLAEDWGQDAKPSAEKPDGAIPETSHQLEDEQPDAGAQASAAESVGLAPRIKPGARASKLTVSPNAAPETKLSAMLPAGKAQPLGEKLGAMLPPPDLGPSQSAVAMLSPAARIRPLVIAPMLAAQGGFGGLKAPTELAIPDEARMPDATLPKDMLTIDRAHTKHKMIALTVDDGPHPEYTSQLLAIFARYNVKATFDIVGVQAVKNPQWVKMIHQAGHELASHTYDHFRLPKLPTEEKAYQIDENQRLIAQLTGVTPRFLLSPGGQTDPEVEQLCRKRGMVVALWDVGLNDLSPNRNAQDMASTAINETKAGSIILAHDGSQPFIDALPAIIEGLRAKGFEFVTLSELASQR